jgi:hypothetical protein
MSLIEHTSCDSCDQPVADPATVESLKMLLDYAIAEGAGLHLPVFVLLLKMADLELAKCARGDTHLGSDVLSARNPDARVSP